MSQATQTATELTHPVPMAAVSAPAQPKLPQKKKVWTVQDLLALADDENRYELVRGELIMMTPAGARHGRLAIRLGAALANFVEDRALGGVYAAKTGFVLEDEPQTVRAPDASFVRQERIPPEGEPKGFWTLAPDLAIEIVSPSETAQHIHEKVADYLRAGTRLIWLVYPDSQTVMEYHPPMEARRLTVEDDLDGGDVVPGFRYPLKRLFA